MDSSIHHLQVMLDEINSIHLSYLQTEECLTKIKEKNRLEDVIKKYLSLVEHHRKFYHTEVPYILRKSVKNKKDFSASKAISAWSALATYAHNLVTQPWRKEFYEIKKYGGFFSHNIKHVLMDWELIFNLMGYNCDQDIMVLEGSIDSAKITFVARDCLIAQVECQIMLKIYGVVLKIHSDCSWEDILNFRETNICSAEQAIRGLNDFFIKRKQEEYLRDTCIPMSVPYCYGTVRSYQSPVALRYLNDYKQLPSYGISMASNPVTHQSSPSDHREFPALLPDRTGFQNCSKHSHPMPNLHQYNQDMVDYAQYYSKNSYNCLYGPQTSDEHRLHGNNSYGCINVPVPSNRDLCTNCHGYAYGAVYPYDCSSGCNKYPSHSYNFPSAYRSRASKTDNTLIKHMRDSEHWPQASKENTSYMKKKSNFENPVSKSDLENAMKAFSLEDFEKSAFSDNSDHTDRSSSSYSDKEKKKPVPKITEKIPEVIGLWECIYCTYHNSSKNKVCEICGKSKSVGSEKVPLIIGGKQCDKCTLVNDKNALICEACSESLEGSHTYI